MRAYLRMLLVAVLLGLGTPALATVLCFFEYETTGGLYKICYYDCLGDPAAITVSSAALCPLTITR